MTTSSTPAAPTARPAGIWLNPHARDWTSTEPASCGDFHDRLPGYAPTPLRDVPDLAEQLGVRRVLVKDESDRFGLPAFKILGASWGVYRALCERLGTQPEWHTVTELGDAIAPLGKPRLITASAGNHGRAVARMARWLGLPAVILLPSTTSDGLADAIGTEGAEVRRVGDSYDEAVTTATELAARDERYLLVQDTSWPGYERIPGWIRQGYQTMFREIDDQLVPDLVVVPVGVGSLLGAALEYYRATTHPTRPSVLAVEPDTAACLLTSLHAGRPVTVPTGNTVMEGLNAGTVSATGWPTFRDGLDATVAVSDAAAIRAGELLADKGIGVGPCGAATLAGLSAAVSAKGAREVLNLTPERRVVALGTDGR
ncbi:MAG: diaminopropionate ammonia-lyase [Pseudonocardiaceae bacterium]|nr:diaminopropionate ammonia-lyase [Pseudonocardiaceae bacterium]